MRKSVAFVLSAGLVASPAFPFTEEELWAKFDATHLTYDEKRFLQMALAFEGTYMSLMDGAWGKGSQRSLEDWAFQNELDLPVENWEVVMLAFENVTRFDKEGWEQRYFEPMDMSFAVPAGQMRSEAPSDAFLNYAHLTSSLRYSLSIGDLPQAIQVHNYALGSAKAISSPYTLRRDAVQITAVEQPEGHILYVRSDLRRGGWSTIVLSAAAQDRHLLNAVSGSIAKGRSAAFDLPPHGKIVEGIGTMAVLLDEAEQHDRGNQDTVAKMQEGMTDLPAGAPGPSPLPNTPQQTVATPLPPVSSPPAEPERISSGTAFVVSQAGHLLTNAHVVETCGSVSIDSRPVELVAIDGDFDLALLRDRSMPITSIATFTPDPAPLNADITIAGYPLNGILSGLNVTRGSVTGLKGLGGDATTMQISAPVQPGNSGGPAVDGSGSVVGVVVSKLDAQMVANATGDIPQNINFAIRGEIAKLFLFQNSVNPAVAASDLEPLGPVEIAQSLEQITRLVDCYSVPK